MTRDATYCKNPYWERNIEITESSTNIINEEDDITEEKTKSDDDLEITTTEIVRATQADPDSKAIIITSQISNILVISSFFYCQFID